MSSMTAQIPMIRKEGIPALVPAIIDMPGLTLEVLSPTVKEGEPADIRIIAKDLQPAIDRCKSEGWPYKL